MNSPVKQNVHLITTAVRNSYFTSVCVCIYLLLSTYSNNKCMCTIFFLFFFLYIYLSKNCLRIQTYFVSHYWSFITNDGYIGKNEYKGNIYIYLYIEITTSEGFFLRSHLSISVYDLLFSKNVASWIYLSLSTTVWAICTSHGSMDGRVAMPFWMK